MNRLLHPMLASLVLLPALAAQASSPRSMPSAPAQPAGPVLLGTPPCPGPAVVRKVVDPAGLNAVGAIGAVGLPTLGSTTFVAKLDDPLDLCTITPGSTTWVIVADEPLLGLTLPNAGCLPGTAGILYVNVLDPSFHYAGPERWAGPGSPVCHALVVPNDPAACGVRCVAQGVWLDRGGAATRLVLTEPLRFIVGS